MVCRFFIRLVRSCWPSNKNILKMFRLFEIESIFFLVLRSNLFGPGFRTCFADALSDSMSVPRVCLPAPVGLLLYNTNIPSMPRFPGKSFSCFLVKCKIVSAGVTMMLNISLVPKFLSDCRWERY